MVTVQGIPVLLRKISPYFICLSLFMLPLSTSAREILIAAFILSWLLTSQFKNLKIIFKEYPFAVFTLALFILFAIGMIYSPATIEHRLDMLKTYRNLVYVPIVLSIWHQSSVDWEVGVKSIMAGVLVALIASVLLTNGYLPRSLAHISYNTIISPTPYSAFVAILIYFLLFKVISNRKKWFVYFPIIIISFYNLFYQVKSSTGIVMFFALMLLLVYQICNLKKVIIGLVVIGVLFVGVYKSSDKMSNEVNEIYTTVTQYQVGSGAVHNNVSLRLDWWYSCALLIKEKPILGYGLGSFVTVHDKLVEGTPIRKIHSPHNDYFLIGVESGVVGVIMFIMILIIPWCRSFSLEHKAKCYLQSLVVFFALGNMFEGWLSGHLISFFYLLCVSMILAGAKCKPRARKLGVT